MMDPKERESKQPGLTCRVEEDTGTLFVHIDDPHDWPGASADDVTAALAKAGFGDWAVSEKDLAVFLDALGTGDPALSDREFLLARRLDGSFSLALDAGKQAATLSVCPPQGGREVSSEQVLQAVAAQGIVHGLDEDSMRQVVQAGARARTEAVIAVATLPVHGNDTVFESLVPQARQRMPYIDEHGRADYRNLGDVPQVSVDTPVMRRHPATPGTPGTNLLGQVIPARPGRELAFSSSLRNVRLSPDDPNVLLSTISGAPVVVPRGVLVEESLRVDRVDLSSGNLNFEGSVVIRDDVIAGMKVVASGDIIVNGMVEGAILEAGGDIQVRHGVVGQLQHHEDGSHHKVRPTARLKAAGTVSAHFLENAWVQARDVVIHEQVFHSQVSASHAVIVGGQGARKGQIVGGLVRARELIECLLLGSPSGPHTQVVAGIDPGLRDRISELDQRIQEQNRLADELTRTVHFAKQHPERVAADFLRRAANTLAEAQAHIRELEMEKEALVAQQGRCQSACVLVRQRIFHGVEVFVGDRSRRIETEVMGGLFRLSGGELILDHAAS